MESKVRDDVWQSSQLLQLPRELRNLIYEYLLTYDDIIPIGYAVTGVQPYSSSTATEAQCLEYLAKVITHCPPRSARRRRRTWTISAKDLGLSHYGKWNFMTNFDTIQLTYQLAVSDKIYSRQNINLALMMVCQQLYAEASEFFYGKNTFSFTGRHNILTAFSFLSERSATALLCFQSLELAVLEKKFPTPFRPEISEIFLSKTKQPTDALFLKYGYEAFSDLCSLMASRMQLRKLRLIVRTYYRNARQDHQPSRALQLQFEGKDSGDKGSLIPYWIDPLLNIKDLEVLTVCWAFYKPQLRRMRDTVSLMRQHMLKSSKKFRPPQEALDSSPKNDAFSFRALHTNKTKERNDLLIERSTTRSLRWWRSYVIQDQCLKAVPDSATLWNLDDIAARDMYLRCGWGEQRGMYIFECEMRNE